MAIWSWLFLLFSTILFSFTNLNIFIQDLFFDFNTNQWLIDPHDQNIKTLFYVLPKQLVIWIGIGLVLIILSSFKFDRLRQYRYGCLLVLLSLITVPGVVALLKIITNVYCPDELMRYNGTMPYVTLFENYPVNFAPSKSGKCFPAAHSTIGFAFMSLFFVFRRNTYKWIGLVGGIVFGWIIGIYQVMRGTHFVYDTFSSMLIGWITIVALDKIINLLLRKSLRKNRNYS